MVTSHSSTAEFDKNGQQRRPNSSCVTRIVSVEDRVGTTPPTDTSLFVNLAKAASPLHEVEIFTGATTSAKEGGTASNLDLFDMEPRAALICCWTAIVDVISLCKCAKHREGGRVSSSSVFDDFKTCRWAGFASP